MKKRFKRFRITKVGLIHYRKTKKIKKLRCEAVHKKKESSIQPRSKQL